MSIPVVDFQSEGAAEKFVTSLHETGFGVLSNHPINQSLVNSIYEKWQGFFDSKEKHDFLFNPDRYDGFFPITISETAKGETIKDIKEYFHYYPWGKVPEELKEDVSAYYQQSISLAEQLLQWIQDETPIDISRNFSQPLGKMIDGSDQTLLRLLHYPPLSGEEDLGAIRAAAHEDINLITILPAANASGLQVQLKSGEWFDVPSEFGSLIINIGDMLQEASGGYFPSTSHRVVNPEGTDKTKSRISIPLFLHPRPDVVLSERYTAGSYLQERLKELGVK